MKKWFLFLSLFSFNAYAMHSPCEDRSIVSSYYRVKAKSKKFTSAINTIAEDAILLATRCKVESLFPIDTKCIEITNNTFPVCIIETKIGFFTVSFDYNENINIVYAIWD